MIFSQYLRLNVHPTASDREVIRRARTLMNRQARRSREMKQARREWLAAILKEHASWRDMYIRRITRSER